MTNIKHTDVIVESTATDCCSFDLKAHILQWVEAKKQEQQANARRLTIERVMLENLNLTNSGTNNFEYGLKILTGFTATCERDKVSELYNKWQNGQLMVANFPFAVKWEPNIRELNVISHNDPILYTQYIADCVTIKPKKPTFEVNISKLNIGD